MKIQLDTTNKTIKVQENVKLDKFMSLLKKILPNNEWKQFTLETNTTIQSFSYPIYIDRHWHDPYPWYSGTTYVSNSKSWTSAGNTLTMSSTGESKMLGYKLKSGVYNIETK